MSKLVLKKNSDGPKKKQPHIMVVGWTELQRTVVDFLENSIGDMNPIIKYPRFAEVEKYLSQIEPNLVIVTNYKMDMNITLEGIIAKVPVTSIIVMCDQYTLAKAIPTGVYVTFTKMHMDRNLMSLVKKILESQGY